MEEEKEVGEEEVEVEEAEEEELQQEQEGTQTPNYWEENQSTLKGIDETSTDSSPT